MLDVYILCEFSLLLSYYLRTIYSDNNITLLYIIICARGAVYLHIRVLYAHIGIIIILNTEHDMGARVR